MRGHIVEAIILLNKRIVVDVFLRLPSTEFISKACPLDEVHRFLGLLLGNIAKLSSSSRSLLRYCRIHANSLDSMKLWRAIRTVPHSVRHFAKRRLQTLESIHGITMVAKNHFVVRGSTFSIALAAGVFPGSCPWIGPSEVAFAKLQDPSVVQSFKLLRHVISHMPDCRSVLVVDLAVIPYLSVGINRSENRA